MSFEKDLRAKIETVGADVYWDARPQGTALPAVVLEIVFGARAQTYGGLSSGQGHRIQARIIAETYKEAAELRDLIMAEIETPGTQGVTEFQGGFVNYFGTGARNTTEQVIYSQIIDADIWVN